MIEPLPLILGGHSLISQLGNDPAPSPFEQIEIVASCLDHGITWFDTTYLPERVALGRALKALNARSRATIIAWNFFVDFTAGQEVGGAAYYQPHHIGQMLDELQTDVIDCLVVHALNDAEKNAQQVALAVEWQSKGYVKQLGTWHPSVEEMTNPASAIVLKQYSFMVRPFNVTTLETASVFARAKALGWQTLACSPFVRGWELDRLVRNALALEHTSEEQVRARLADYMLRYSLFQPDVDRLIVSMRKSEWVGRNTDSVQRGALLESEDQWLRNVAQSNV